MSGEPVEVHAPGPPKPQPAQDPATQTWTVKDLISGAQRREKVMIEMNGQTRPVIIRPILSHELAELNKTFASEEWQVRQAAFVQRCIVEPQLTFEDAKQLLPGILDRVFNAIFDISGYSEGSRKNSSG